MDVHVELLTDDIWASEDDKTGFLSVGVYIFDRLYLKERPISLPMVPMSTKNENLINEHKWENSTNKNMRIFYERSKTYFWLSPPIKKLKISEKASQLILMNVYNVFV